jgi:DNA-binding transcriptional MocR family regulator
VGWIRAPEPLIAQLGRLKAVVDLGSPLPSQIIAARLLGDGLQALRRERARCMAERLAHVTTLLHEWLPTWTWDAPRGGLCLWVRLPVGSNATEFAQVALRHGVSIVPGNVASPDGGFADHLRLPFGQEPAVLEEGIRRLAEAWSAYAGPSLERARADAMAVVV